MNDPTRRPRPHDTPVGPPPWVFALTLTIGLAILGGWCVVCTGGFRGFGPTAITMSKRTTPTPAADPLAAGGGGAAVATGKW